MTNPPKEGNTGLELLRQSFPGREDEQILAFGLVYSGIRWGRDFSQSSPPIPIDKTGKPLFNEKDESQLDKFDEWLVEHLLTIPIDPNDEQKGLCKWIDRMIPKDAMILLGMNAALYQLDLETLEGAVENPESYPEVDLADDDVKDLVFQMNSENAQKQKICPDSKLVDLGYRIPLAIALRKLDNKEQRVEHLGYFYKNYSHYIYK